MEWMLLPYKRYFDFSGRSRRKEYWMFFLFVVIIELIIAALLFSQMPLDAYGMADWSGEGVGAGFYALMAVAFIFGLGTIIPQIAVQVRRFHDQDKSGWFVLLNFIPYVGFLIVLVFMFIEGTRGPNRFGADPKDPTNSQVFA